MRAQLLKQRNIAGSSVVLEQGRDNRDKLELSDLQVHSQPTHDGSPLSFWHTGAHHIPLRALGPAALFMEAGATAVPFGLSVSALYHVVCL